MYFGILNLESSTKFYESAPIGTTCNFREEWNY